MNALDRAIVEETVARSIALAESLKKGRHAGTLDPLRAKLRGVMVRRFKRQQKAFLKQAAGWLRKLATEYAESGSFRDRFWSRVERQAGISEADAELKAKLQKIVTVKIDAGSALTDGPSRGDSNAYAGAIMKASKGAIENLSVDLGISAAKNAGNAFAKTYLAQKGFKQLAADVDATSRERIAGAVADVFSEGGDYDAAVSAIKGAFSDFTEKRADMIARTELADAYNQAMLSSAKELGDGWLKVWEPDGEACPEICEPNVAQGPIEIDEEFDSGDDAPPAHPNCDCSLSIVRADEGQ